MVNLEVKMENLREGSVLQERYTIKKILGKGAMGTVYLAEDKRLSKECAIKEMNPSFLEDAEKERFMELFKQEAHILSRLHHLNLPKVIDYFLENKHYYLVMDYIEGENLKEYVEKKNFSLSKDTIESIISQMCDVLEYLHGQKPDPIIFRDLKPSNIMIQNDKTIKLIDFGIARIFKDRQKSDTVIVGTPGFAPPEQYGQRQTDARSDIYSLGATLYYILTGSTPDLPDKKGRKEVMENPKVPKNLQPLILRALEAAPEARFNNIKEFREAFKGKKEEKKVLPVKKEEKNYPHTQEEGKPVNVLLGSALSLLFMLLPAGILALSVYFGRLLAIPHLRGEILLQVLSGLGILGLSGCMTGIVKGLKKIPGFNWQVLLCITVPFALLNARNLFILAVPAYQAGQWGLWNSIVLFTITIPLMFVTGTILMTFLRFQGKTIQEVEEEPARGDDYFIGKCATVTNSLKPLGKIVVDGDEEVLSACSQGGKYIEEGTRVRITGKKMGDFVAEPL